MLLEKNPVALKATKDAIRRVRRDDLRQRRGLSGARAGGGQLLRQRGRKEGIRQFIDEKSYKPGLGAYDGTRARVLSGEAVTEPRPSRSSGCCGRARSRSSAPPPEPGALGASCSRISSAWAFRARSISINPQAHRDRRPAVPQVDRGIAARRRCGRARNPACRRARCHACARARRKAGAAVIFSAGFAEARRRGPANSVSIARIARGSAAW